MCFIELAAIAAVAGTTISVVSGKQQAKAQEAQQNQSLEAEQTRSVAEIAALRQKEGQEREARARDANRMLLQSRKAISTAKVGALEAGASSSNLETVIGEFKRQELGYVEQTQRQEEISTMQYDMSVDNALKQSHASKININQPVSAPSFLEIPLAIGSAMGSLQARKEGLGLAKTPKLKG